MSTVFDGMGSLLTGVFGAPVTVTPTGGAPRVITAAFREAPEPILNEDGFEVVTVLPTLTGLQADMADLLPARDPVSRAERAGGVIEPGNGKTYRAVAWFTSGSPASDATARLRLERIT